MNPTPTNPETPDELDRLFSDFFKAQLKQPWPNAPVPVGATNEPSELAAARGASAPRHAPAPARRDNTARARFTLAASVALALGACWLFSNGFTPSDRITPPVGGGSPSLLPDSGADATKDLRFQKIQENKVKENDGGIKIDLDKE